MQARFARSLFLLLFVNLLVKPLWLLGIDRQVQNLVGNQNYGIYYVLLNLSMYLQILLDPGLHTYTNKLAAQAPEKLTESLSGLLPSKLLLSLVYMGLTLFLGIIFGTGSNTLLFWLAVNQVLLSLVLYFRSVLGGMLQFTADSLLSVLDRLLTIVLCGLLLIVPAWRAGFRLEWFVYAQTAASAAAAVIGAAMVARHVHGFRPRISWSESAKVLAGSIPYALLSILMTLYTRVDSLMIEKFQPDGARQAGIYAAAYRLLDAANMIAFLFSTILLPVFTHLLAHKESPGPTASVTARMLLVPAWILALASYTFREPIMHWLNPESGTEGADVFGGLMAGFPALCLVYVYGTLLTARGSLRFLNITAAAGLIVNVLFNFLLIPRMGALGAVIATLITQYGVSLLQTYRSHRFYSLKIPPYLPVKAAVFIFGTWAAFHFGSQLLNGWLPSLLLLGTFSIIFAFVLQLLDIKYFIRIIKTGRDE